MLSEREFYIDQDYTQIDNLVDFEAAIAGMDEIGVFERNGYRGFQYNVAFPETFLEAAARETRGIVFNISTGRVIRRPFSKYFNVNEKAHTQLEDLAGDEVLWVANKLDGTFIGPFELPEDGSIYWGTKRCAQDFHEAVLFHLSSLPLKDKEDYTGFVRHCLGCNITPMFEFHDPNVEGTVIVLQYGKAFLRLIGLRDMSSGKYIDVRGVQGMINENFPAVEMVDYREITSLQEIKDELETLEGEEGRVIMLRENGLVKMKAPWYCKRHNIKSLFGYAHIKAQLVLEVNDDVSMDDIAPEMMPEDIVEFERFALELHGQLNIVKFWLMTEAAKYETRKEYGLAEKPDNMFDGLVFKVIGSEDPNQAAYNIAVEQVKKKVNKSIRFKEWREAVENLNE